MIRRFVFALFLILPLLALTGGCACYTMQGHGMGHACNMGHKMDCGGCQQACSSRQMGDCCKSMATGNRMQMDDRCKGKAMGKRMQMDDCCKDMAMGNRRVNVRAVKMMGRHRCDDRPDLCWGYCRDSYSGDKSMPGGCDPATCATPCPSSQMGSMKPSCGAAMAPAAGCKPGCGKGGQAPAAGCAGHKK